MAEFNVNLPYFDGLLEKIREGDAEVIEAFGFHVHWGYWGNPATADGSVADFAQAAEELSRRVCDAAKLKDGMRILEVGCGFGGNLASLCDRFSNLELVGLNIDDRQLARARELVQPRNNNKVEFVCADACEIPFADSSFDAVIAVECIFHFPSRDRFFKEAQRVLKYAGSLALSDLVPQAWTLPFIKLTEPLFQPSVSEVFGTVKGDCTLENYRDLARETGFVSRLEEDITINTIPTYPAIRSLERKRGLKQEEIVNSLSELAGRLGLIRYMILSFDKV